MSNLRKSIMRGVFDESSSDEDQGTEFVKLVGFEFHRREMQRVNQPTLHVGSVKQLKPRVPRSPVDPSAVRRSSRVADKPPPNYKEFAIEPLGSLRRTYSYKRRNLSNRVYAADGDREYAVDRAEDVMSGLEPDFPKFVKPMLQSHVTGGFWLGLPVQFCKTYLPEHDEMITLLDEDGKESITKFLALKPGLSGGWRGFAIDHELVDGDALVFQLIKPTTFKVYIIRVNQAEDGNDAEEAPDVAHIDTSAKRLRASKE